MKKSISFIVIAKNESHTIVKSIESIIRIGAKTDEYEIIFIDSASTDNTVEKVLKIPHNKLRKFQLISKPNAARARNIGIKMAKYEFLFFVDGDVELNEIFLNEALKIMEKDSKIAITIGQLKEYQYDHGYNKIISKINDRYFINSRTKNIIRGGIFLSRKIVFEELGLFDEQLIINEDRDIMMRILNKYETIAVPIEMGTHHTIPYGNLKRTIHELLSGNFLFAGLLLRKHLFNLKNLKRLITADPGIYFGLLFWLLLCFSLVINSKNLLILLFTILLVDMLSGLIKNWKWLVRRFSIHYIAPIYLLVGFFTYYPKKGASTWREL